MSKTTTFLQALIQSEAWMAAQAEGRTEWAIISSYNPDNYTARVKYEGRLNSPESNWFPIATLQAGNGWGIFFPPSIGDLVMVDYIGGDKEVGVIRFGIFNKVNRSLKVPSGEIWLTHKNGASIKLTNDGKLRLGSNTEIDLVCSNIKAGDGATFYRVFNETFLALFNAHTHNLDMPHNTTLQPNTLATDANLTTDFKAS